LKTCQAVPGWRADARYYPARFHRLQASRTDKRTPENFSMDDKPETGVYNAAIKVNDLFII
jgi:hypothetical protein